MLSPETSTANQPGPLSTTVRHTPEQASDAPRSTCVMSKCVSTTSRVSPRASTEAIVPMSVMIPVNILALVSTALVDLDSVAAKRACVVQPPAAMRGGEIGEPDIGQRTSAADENR